MPWRWEDDVTPAAWLGERLTTFGRSVASIVPDCFDAYARVFHPVVGHRSGATTWAGVAASTGRAAHAAMQFHAIDPEGGLHPHEVSWGDLPAAERAVLVDVLREQTATPDACWFCVWEGFGDVDLPEGPRVALPGREYALARGPIEQALEPMPGAWAREQIWYAARIDPAGGPPRAPSRRRQRQLRRAQQRAPVRRLPPSDRSSNLWWPADRAWCVATEIDFAWTYVGGSPATVAALVAASGLEAWLCALTDDPTINGDVVNR